jgi:hypothetical protein
MHKLIKLLKRLAKPDIAFYCLPWLMLLLTVGTIAQKYMGLYMAQKMFFSSWVFFWGFLPLPGGYTAITIIGVSLACKFIFESQWSYNKSGIIIAHLGALILLFGGILTGLTTREGFIMIGEGQEYNRLEDYHDKYLTIYDDADNTIIALHQSAIKEGHEFKVRNLTMKIISHCLNCKAAEQTETAQGGLQYIGPASKIKMEPIPRDLNEEVNHSAISLAVRGSDNGADGIYLMSDIMPHQPIIDDLKIRFGRKETILPFSLHLNDIRRDLYPGTSMAQAYESFLIVKDNDTNWPAHIRMNHPLRYKGYTFYQSNYAILQDGSEATILSVVKNSGWIFPYIASIVMAIGLIMHLAITLARTGSKQ